jgi:hypothetical protein
LLIRGVLILIFAALFRDFGLALLCLQIFSISSLLRFLFETNIQFFKPLPCPLLVLTSDADPLKVILEFLAHLLLDYLPGFDDHVLDGRRDFPD